jgi:hypothetical protein
VTRHRKWIQHPLHVTTNAIGEQQFIIMHAETLIWHNHPHSTEPLPLSHIESSTPMLGPMLHRKIFAQFIPRREIVPHKFLTNFSMENRETWVIGTWRRERREREREAIAVKIIWSLLKTWWCSWLPASRKSLNREEQEIVGSVTEHLPSEYLFGSRGAGTLARDVVWDLGEANGSDGHVGRIGRWVSRVGLP